VIGVVVGRVLAQLAFRSKQPSLRLAELGEPLLALAAVLLAYGVAEVCGGYGFLAVFACAMTLRAAERGSDYHAHMHESIERLERLLTLVVLLLLGVALTNSLFEVLTWQGALVGAALVFVIRPLSGLVALRPGAGGDRMGDTSLTRAEQNAAAFFGVRGVGALYYMAYATGEVDLPLAEQLWATVAFTIALSVLVHGVTATPVMKRLEDSTA
jgi:NhaP-type Na+/H+ or K+/H+ antiporter